MDTKNDGREKQCNIIIESRRKISVSAVEDVDSFDEESIALVTSEGTLVIKGKDFHINKLNVDTGELIIEGDFDSCAFDEGYKTKNGDSLWSKMFK